MPFRKVARYLSNTQGFVNIIHVLNSQKIQTKSSQEIALFFCYKGSEHSKVILKNSKGTITIRKSFVMGEYVSLI